MDTQDGPAVTSSDSALENAGDNVDGEGDENVRCGRLRRQCRRGEAGSCAELSASCRVKIGVIGDSLSDEYQGSVSQLPALTWTEQVQASEHISLGFSATRPEPRNDGYVLNWARFGQAANSPQWSELDPAVRKACVNQGDPEGPDDPRLLTIGSFDDQIAGLGRQIRFGRIDVALVWIGHNDLFIAQCTGQDLNAVGAALIAKIIGAATELKQYADGDLGAPRAKVAIVGLAGTAAALNPSLQAAAANAGITYIDPFNTAVATIVGTQYATASATAPNGAFFVGATPLVPFTLTFVSDPPAIPKTANLGQLSPAGAGPCSSFPLGVELCSTSAYAEPFQNWDAIHPNTIYMGVIGNQILADLNAAFGFAMQPISDDELLGNAGLL